MQVVSVRKARQYTRTACSFRHAGTVPVIYEDKYKHEIEINITARHFKRQVQDDAIVLSARRGPTSFHKDKHRPNIIGMTYFIPQIRAQ